VFEENELQYSADGGLSGVDAGKPQRTDEQRKDDRERQAKHRERVKWAKDQQSPRYDFPHEISRNDAEKILIEERHIRHPHVLEVLLDLADVAAEQNKLVKNKYFYTQGISQMLASIEAKENLPRVEIEDVWLPGDRIRLHEQWALWDYSMSWRVNKGFNEDEKLDFDGFREWRRVCMIDPYRSGREVHKKDFHPQPHGRWCKELFVTKNPDLLPEEYDQEDFKKALGAQSDIHNRMLLAARNSYKSSYSVVDLVSWVLVFPSIRIWSVSATKPLSKGFLKQFRDYFTVDNPRSPKVFAQLFPEFMVGPDDGIAGSFTCPMRRLSLIQPTFTSSSMSSEGVAGERADLILFDDACEQSNSGTPEMREKTLETFGLIREILEPTGFVEIRGTPYSVGDLYDSILQREENKSEPTFYYQIDPAWQVKTGVDKLPYDKSLTADEVDLLFPERLGFKFLMGKLEDDFRNNLKTFRQQQLCQWVPDVDEAIRLQFNRAKILTPNVIPYDLIPKTGLIVAAADLAFSTSKYSDETSLSFVNISTDPVTQAQQATLIWQESGHYPDSEKAEIIARLTKRYHPQVFLMEKHASYESLGRSIAEWADRYGVVVPIKWIDADNTTSAKFKRFKSMEADIATGRVKFVSSPWVDALFDQLESLDGASKIKSSSKKKDDRSDSLSLILKYYFPRPGDPDVELARKEQEEANNQRILQEQTDAIFNGKFRHRLYNPGDFQPERERQTYRGMFGIPGLRGGSDSPPPRHSGPRSFGDISKRTN